MSVASGTYSLWFGEHNGIANGLESLAAITTGSNAHVSESLAPTCATPTTGAAAATFASALKILAAAQCLIREPWPTDATVQDGEKFDFIIIGAGSAGSVVANRLSEIDHWKVLLIEAGGDPPQESIIPYLAPTLEKTEYNWNYTSINDKKSSQGLKDAVVNLPRGKMLGGSSSLNYMVYFQGARHDYKTWYDLGNEEWHPDVAKHYSNKAESLQNKELLKNPFISKAYGKTGPLVINSFNSTLRHISNNVLDAWNELGFKNVPDLNGADLLGSGIFRGTAANGHRQSTAVAYLNNIKRPNLKIIKYTLANKILIDDQNKAIGVEVERYGKTLKLYADKEVISSAGSFNSPQLLMLSGVGPKETLKGLGIPCKVDLPGVGQNLQDNLFVLVPIFGDKPGESDKLKEAFDTVRYLYDRAGHLAQTGFPDVSAFFSLDKNATHADFEVHTQYFFKNPDINALTAFAGRYEDSILKSIIKQAKNKFSYFFVFVYLKQRSRGSITLTSADPKDHPYINTGYFDDPEDLEHAVTGIKVLTKIVNTKYFKSINAKLGRLDWAPCNNFELDSREYWKCIALDTASTLYHTIGTCSMGCDPSTAVVDSRLRVHGVEQLRVIDASVMPVITACNTNGPTIMIGERASDMIKEDYGECS